MVTILTVAQELATVVTICSLAGYIISIFLKPVFELCEFERDNLHIKIQQAQQAQQAQQSQNNKNG